MLTAGTARAGAQPHRNGLIDSTDLVLFFATDSGTLLGDPLPQVVGPVPSHAVTIELEGR
jgi:hypothetical protein